MLASLRTAPLKLHIWCPAEMSQSWVTLGIVIKICARAMESQSSSYPLPWHAVLIETRHWVFMIQVCIKPLPHVCTSRNQFTLGIFKENKPCSAQFKSKSPHIFRVKQTLHSQVFCWSAAIWTFASLIWVYFYMSYQLSFYFFKYNI